jgi:hypothetical protein
MLGAFVAAMVSGEFRIVDVLRTGKPVGLALCGRIGFDGLSAVFSLLAAPSARA